jgi:hypothetical protein
MSAQCIWSALQRLRMTPVMSLKGFMIEGRAISDSFTRRRKKTPTAIAPSCWHRDDTAHVHAHFVSSPSQ